MKKKTVPPMRALFAVGSGVCSDDGLKFCDLVGAKPLVPGEAKTPWEELTVPEGAFLILVSGYRRSRWFTFSLNSTASALIRRANCPTLFISEAAKADTRFAVKHIVCGVSFDSHTAALVSQASRFAELFGARLTLVHVIPEVSEDLLLCGVLGTSEIVFSATEARRKLINAVKQAQLALTPKIEVLFGCVDSELAKYARKHGSDLTVIGGARGGIPHVLYSLLDDPHCQVLRIPQARECELITALKLPSFIELAKHCSRVQKFIGSVESGGLRGSFVTTRRPFPALGHAHPCQSVT
ncbi:MAG: universal stress protein [Bryobacteraceae bacterium]|nr:universal stress protein [Bryobacteraceae bacterium]